MTSDRGFGAVPSPQMVDAAGEIIMKPGDVEAPARSASRENGLGRKPSPLSRKPVALKMADPGTKLHSGPLAPVYINSASINQIPQATEVVVEDSAAFLDHPRASSADMDSVQKENAQTHVRANKSESFSALRSPRSPRSPSDAAQHAKMPQSPHNFSTNTRSPRILSPLSSEHSAPRHQSAGSTSSKESTTGKKSPTQSTRSHDSMGSSSGENSAPLVPSLPYHHDAAIRSMLPAARLSNSLANLRAGASPSPPVPRSRQASQEHSPTSNTTMGADIQRPQSAYSAASEQLRGRNSHLYTATPRAQVRSSSHGGLLSKRRSHFDMLTQPYPQPAPTAGNFNNTHLQTVVGSNASLLSQKQTLDMYRANVKKTGDPAIQYEFAIFMINAAQELMANPPEAIPPVPPLPANLDGTMSPPLRMGTPRTQSGPGSPATQPSSTTPSELLHEGRTILQRLADRSYPFAQYYLADGFSSGLFNKARSDNDRAFPLFIAAAKHGHAESCFRGALCYEYGWGTRKDALKAVQFFRQSASRNHPGAMARLGRACLHGDLGLLHHEREGLKWLKRAAESADFQYNSAPFELGLLHETGFGGDVFKDEKYAAQLFTQSADLGHVEANYRMGDAYEHGKLGCPRDPALSVHFYTAAAERGHAPAMMALCAWYLVGAEPVLARDETEAYEWAKSAAELAYPKAEYAVGYFTEMGIGTRRDPLEANVWYVRAADQGDERATQRIARIRAAASGETVPGVASAARKTRAAGSPVLAEGEEGRKKKWGIF